MLKLSQNIIWLLLGLGCLVFLLVLYIYFTSSGSVVNLPQKTPQDLSELDKIRLECFDIVDSLDYKDDTKFNEFRSIYDYRLYKYNECLRDRGVKQF